MHVVVYGCMWWCTDACGHFDCAHRPHKDTPPGYLEVASDRILKNKLLRCCVVRYLSLKTAGLINDDYIDMFRQGTFKRFVVQMPQIEIEIQRLIDACVQCRSK